MSGQELHLETGGSLRVHDEGGGPLVLLVSGLGGTAAFWQHQRRDLVAAGYRVISFDQPGCGAALPREGPVTVADLARMTAQMLARVAPETPLAAMIGHSTGGAIAQEYHRLGLRPAPGRMVLSGTWARACPYMHSLFAFRIRSLGRDFDADFADFGELSWLLGVTPSDVDQPRVFVPSGPDRTRAATQVARMRALLEFDAEKAAPGLDRPVLVLGAQDDRIVPAYHQRALADAIPGAGLHLFTDGGHFFPQSRHSAFNALIQDWLGR